MYYCLQYSSGFDELLFTVFLGFVVLLYTVFLVLMHYVYWWMYLIEWKNHVIYFFFQANSKTIIETWIFQKGKGKYTNTVLLISAQSSESKFKRAFLIIGILAHLSWKLKWAFLIPCCLSVRLSICL